MSDAKPCDKLNPSDIDKHPVWTFDLDNEGLPGRDETWMVPVKRLPVTSLSNHGCFANATLACGKPIFAMLWSVDLKSAAKTEQFIAISFWMDEKWWHLSRYYDLDSSYPSHGGMRETHCPSDLASKLGLRIDQVFPISYDISKFAVGPEKITKGQVVIEPSKKLTRSQRISLSLG